MLNYSEKIIEDWIMQKRHTFIYGYNNSEREKILRSYEEKYPILLNNNQPVALYMDSFGIPEIDEERINTKLLKEIGYEHFQFEIASKIVERTLERNDIDESRFNSIIESLDNSRNEEFSLEHINTLKDLSKELKNSRDYYYNLYMDAINGKIKENPYNVSLTNMFIDWFISDYKKALNMDSAFMLILDRKSKISLSSTRAINGFIAARINKDLNIKVAIEPGEWKTFTGIVGERIEPIHDFDVVELDESKHEYTMKKVKEAELRFKLD